MKAPPAMLAGMALLAAAGAGCRQSPTAVRPAAVRELQAPAPPGSGEPNLARSPDGSVYLTWVEPGAGGGHRLRFARRTDGGEWSEPRTIAEGTGWFVNWADFPSLVALDERTLAAHWLARSGAGTYAYDVRVTASGDGGLTWTPPVVPHRDGTQTEHGFVSFVPWPGGGAGLVWLDGRHTGGGHGPGAMALMGATVDQRGVVGAEWLLDDRVCDCCQTAAAATDDGPVVAYRDRSPAEVRDISVVRWAGGRWTAPRTVAADGWTINGCPVNGPALSAQGRTVALAWFTAPDDVARVHVAFSADAGAHFGAPLRVDEGKPGGRVDVVLLDGGDALVSWLENTSSSGAEVRVRRVRADGRLGPSLTVAGSSAARSSGFPRMERGGREVVVAWRDPAEPPRVRTAVLTP